MHGSDARMMTAVYRFQVAEGQEWIFPADETDFEMFAAMDGSIVREWQPPAMTIDSDDRTYSDFPWLGEHVLFLRLPAKDALAPTLLRYGQLLPVRGENVWLFNATNVLDVLDRNGSRVAYFDDGSILAIERHAFDAHGIGASEVFKLPMRASSIYVTDRFVERVQNAGLRGVAFEMVWNSAVS